MEPLKPLKIKGHDHLIRDPYTNSIINTNMLEYNEYLTRRESKTKECEKIRDIENDIHTVKTDLEEIKSLLRNLVNES